MSERRAKSPRARVFVALDIPEAVREGLAGWGAEALRDPALRPISPGSLHVTLAFLGYRDEADLEAIAGCMRESAGPAPWIELSGPVQRPPRGRARLYALPALSPGTEALRAGLEAKLVEAGHHEPESRPFWPHLTVARVRSESPGSRRPMRVETAPEDLPTGLSEPFLGVRMTLYRSELQPAGASYVPLAQVELPGAGRQ